MNQVLGISIEKICLFLSNVVASLRRALHVDGLGETSWLDNPPKVYERVMFKQIRDFMENFFTKFQCAFRKGYSTQQCLIALIEKWKSATDKGKSFGALLTDLSKAFDCLPHELLIAKLNAYGFSLAALRLVRSYFSNRKQRTKINESYSSWEEILFGVPQGFILGPLLFNISICDLFIMIDDINIANINIDNTPFVSSDTPLNVITSLENAAEKLFEWFTNNHMKANHDKYHQLMSTITPISIKVKDYIIKNSDYEKLLGVTVDANLNFNCHLENILKKANKKAHVLARITPYMSIPKRKLLMNSFFTSQFNYCTLTWMCHSRTMNNKINRLHERCLRIIYSDKTSSFEKLLEKDGSVTIHTRNLQTLATEMFKVYKNLSPAIIADIFHIRQNNYNLRHDSYLAIPNVKSVYHGTESLSNLGPRIWNLVPDKLKQLVDIYAFKKDIKKWKPKNRPCRLCKTYIPYVGFI